MTPGGPSQSKPAWSRTSGFSTTPAFFFDGADNNNASIFPVAMSEPEGKPAMAILDKRFFPGTHSEETASEPRSHEVDLDRP